MKQNKKRMAMLAGAFAVMTLAAGCGKTEIGYVDPSRVEKEAPAIMNIDAEMKSKVEEVQKQAQEELKEKQAQGAPPEEMQQAQQHLRSAEDDQTADGRRRDCTYEEVGCGSLQRG